MLRKQGMLESHTEKDEMRQQPRMKVMADMTRKIKAKGRMNANNSWWDSELLAVDCQKSVTPFRMGRHHATMVQSACGTCNVDFATDVPQSWDGWAGGRDTSVSVLPFGLKGNSVANF